jgi:hypothetical protein
VKITEYLMTLTKTASVIGVKGNGGSVKASGGYVRKTIRRFESFVESLASGETESSIWNSRTQEGKCRTKPSIGWKACEGGRRSLFPVIRSGNS